MICMHSTGSFEFKAGYTARQSRTVAQGPQCKNRSKFGNIFTDLPTDRPTGQGVESRVRDLKMSYVS